MRNRPNVTLFDQWRGKVPKIEGQIYNPLKLNVGNHLKIDILDLDGYQFKVMGLIDRTWDIGSDTFTACAYLIKGTGLEKDDLELELRVYANDSVAGGMFILLLEMEEESAYDNVLFEALSQSYTSGGPFNALDDSQPDGIARDDNGDLWQFWPALEGLNLPRGVEALKLEDTDHDGTVEEEELSREVIQEYEFTRYITLPWKEEKEVEYLIFDLVLEISSVILIRRYRGHQLAFSAVKI